VSNRTAGIMKLIIIEKIKKKMKVSTGYNDVVSCMCVLSRSCVQSYCWYYKVNNNRIIIEKIKKKMKVSFGWPE